MRPETYVESPCECALFCFLRSEFAQSPLDALTNHGIFEAIDRPGIAVGRPLIRLDSQCSLDLDVAGRVIGRDSIPQNDIGQVVGLAAGPELALRVLQEDESLDSHAR